MEYYKRCECCKRWFYTPRKNRKYCSPNCCQKGDRLKRKERYVRSKEGNVSSEKNRELTEDTGYLCQKWYKEGMSVKEIANCLDRSTESVEKALKCPLNSVQKEKMKVFLMPKRSCNK